MKSTKDRILKTALNLFAQRGFDAVSMRDIAGELGITAGALYRHYAGKQDIFQSILRRMEEFDRKNAVQCSLPQEGYTENPDSYQDIGHAELMEFTLCMFRHWTENEFASAFRRLLTLEQYRSPEMNALYQQYFGSGVLHYLEDLFRTNGSKDPETDAYRFYAPFYLLMNQYDTAGRKKKQLIRQLKRILQ